MTKLSPFAGQLPGPEDLIDVPGLLHAYESRQPDPEIPAQRVRFGTSGHRGSSLDTSFNRSHILAISQAICLYRTLRGTTGPLFLGFDTHALSVPAFQDALEVLCANHVTVMIARDQEYTPTPVISHAILAYNRGRESGLADGIVITPSHNPPREGGFKYNPSHGGPAGGEATDWIQAQANRMLADRLAGVSRVPYERAIRAETTHAVDLRDAYIRDLSQVVDMDVIRGSGIQIGADPMGGAGVHYWEPIAERYGIRLTVLNERVDPRFSFVPRDWDGQIRMDPSSRFAMQSLIRETRGGQEGRSFDIAFACDTDHDRHGIVTKGDGLIPPNAFLSAAAFYLFKHRPSWPANLALGKTVVTSGMLDRVAGMLGRPLHEVPVGFKWFVDGLLGAKVGFAGEESAGASFLRRDGTPWTTDKDGIVMALLAAEMTASLGKDPAVLYLELTDRLGEPRYDRLEWPATALQRERIGRASAADVGSESVAGERVARILTRAPGNDAPIGGIKVETESGWVAVRPSGTEDIYKVYAESFQGQEHLAALLEEGQRIAGRALESPSRSPDEAISPARIP